MSSTAIFAIRPYCVQRKSLMNLPWKSVAGCVSGTRNEVVRSMGTMGGEEALKTLQEWSKEENLEPSLSRILRQAVLSVRHRLDAQKQ